MEIEKRTIILPLTKSPHAHGRWGAVEKQDWFMGCVIAVRIKKVIPNSEILILSNVQVGERHEVDLYKKALSSLGEKNPLIKREAYETIVQLDIAFEMAEKERKNLVIITTFLHYPRVRYLCWLGKFRGDYKIKATHRAAWGIPRPREAVTDVIFTFLFPVIDVLGLRNWFLMKIEKRRKAGKH